MIWVAIGRIFVGFLLMDLPSRINCQNGYEITESLILSVGSGSKLLMMITLSVVPCWSQALTYLPTWAVSHLLEECFWVYTLETQRCDDSLSWVTPALGSPYLLGRCISPCQVSCSLFFFCFVVRKATGSALLRSSILIWHELSVLLIILGDPWSSFPNIIFWRWPLTPQ